MEYYPFHLKDISTYRSELMGWSILWIMLLHFTFNQIKPLGFIAQYGFAGVDIFIFVSGLGEEKVIGFLNDYFHWYYEEKDKQEKALKNISNILYHRVHFELAT